MWMLWQKFWSINSLKLSSLRRNEMFGLLTNALVIVLSFSCHAGHTWAQNSQTCRPKTCYHCLTRINLVHSSILLLSETRSHVTLSKCPLLSTRRHAAVDKRNRLAALAPVFNFN